MERSPSFIGGALPPLVGNRFSAPHIVRECILNIEKNCHLEGLFEYDLRHPYSEQVKQFDEQLRQVKRGSISTLLPNAHIACGTLKHYFDKLQSPLVFVTDFAHLDLTQTGTARTLAYAQFVEALRRKPLENQHFFAYVVNFCYRLQRKQARLTPQLLGKTLGSHILRSEDGGYSPRAVDLFTLVLTEFHRHFPQGTAIPEPPKVDTISVYDDDETPGGFIAVRVNNYQVTALMPGVKVKSVRALFKFEARKEEEISMEPGDIIEVTYQDDEPGWWEGRLRGCTGLFPSNYCEVYEVLKRKKRKMKIDTTKVSNRILLMQNALTMNSNIEPNKEKEDDEYVAVSQKEEEEKKAQQAAAQANAGPVQEETLPNLAETKFASLKIAEDIQEAHCAAQQDALQAYHALLFQCQATLTEDINRGESNEPLVFHIEPQADTSSENKEEQERKQQEQQAAEKKQQQQKEAKEAAARAEKEKAAAEAKKAEENERAARAEAKRKEEEAAAQKKKADEAEKEQQEKQARAEKDAKDAADKKASSEQKKTKRDEKASKKHSEAKSKSKDKEPAKEETPKDDKPSTKDEAKEEKKASSSKKDKASSAKKDKSSTKKEKSKKPSKSSKKAEPAAEEVPSEGKKAVPAIQVEEDKPAAEPVVSKAKDEEPKQDKAPTPKQVSPAPSPKSPKAAKSAELAATPASEPSSSPKTPKKQKNSPRVDLAPKKDSAPRLSSPDVVRRTIAKKVDSSSSKSISAIIRSREVHSPSLRISSDMFKADQKLFEEFQQLQRQIEEERRRRHEIDEALDATAHQLVSVVSKFETRNLAKERLIRSIPSR